MVGNLGGVGSIRKGFKSRASADEESLPEGHSFSPRAGVCLYDILPLQIWDLPASSYNRINQFLATNFNIYLLLALLLCWLTQWVWNIFQRQGQGVCQCSGLTSE